MQPGGRWARRNLVGMPCRQGPSTLCGSHICLHVSLPTAPDALQFHTVWSFSVQNIVDELIHGRPTGYFLHFFLLLRQFPSLEESDSMLCPCRSLGLDGKDQRHFLCHGSGCLYGQGLMPCRSQLPHGRLSIHGNIFTSDSRELGGEVLAGALFPRFVLLC